MKALIVLSFDVPTPEAVAVALRSIDPRHLEHFAGEARIVLEPHASSVTRDLDAIEHDQVAPGDEKMRDRAAGILLYAFRYAMGRQTYAVNDVVSALFAAATSLPASTRGIIIREIEEALSAHRAGSANDIAQWRALAARLASVGEGE